MSGSIIPPGVSQVIAVLQDLVRATYAAGPNTSRAAAADLAVYSASGLPASANIGQVAFVSNARNSGEAAGAGTGCLCVMNSQGTWVCVYNGLAPTT